MSYRAKLLNPTGVLTAVVLSFVTVAGAQADDEPPAGYGVGPFQELAEPLGKLLKLAIADGRLVLDRTLWRWEHRGKSEEETREAIIQDLIKRGVPRPVAEAQAHVQLQLPDVEQVFEKLFENAREGTIRSRHFSNIFRVEFAGPKFKASMERQEKAIRFDLVEEIGPKRRIQISDEGQGEFRLSLTNDDGSLALVVTQTSDGSLKVTDESRGHGFKAEADSFQEFYDKEPAYVEERLIPLLNHLAIVLPLSRDRAEVQKAVLDQLEAMRSANVEEFEKLVAQLDDEDFTVREAAYERITAGIRRFGPLARKLADDPDSPFPPETQARIGRLVDELADSAEAHEFASTNKLVSDVGYLVALIEESPETARPVVAEQLTRLTGQNHGTDPAAWRAWYDSTQAQADASSDEIR
jgi:hypothetical protein